MRRASDAPWKVWGNRLVYRMSRTEKISGRRDDLGGRARGPVRQRQLRRGSLLLLTTNHDQGGAENARARRTSVASRTHWISFGDLRHRRRNEIGGASVSFMRAFRPPCQRTGAPLGIANGRGRRNLPRGGPLGGLLCSVWCATRRLHSHIIVACRSRPSLHQKRLFSRSRLVSFGYGPWEPNDF